MAETQFKHEKHVVLHVKLCVGQSQRKTTFVFCVESDGVVHNQA